MKVGSLRSRSRGFSRQAFALLVGLAPLLSATPTSLAQDASSETTVSIAVLSVEFTTSSPSTQTEEAAAPSLTAPQAGTVSSRFVRIHGNEQTGRADDMVMSIIIGDDRGTAAGWDVKSSFAPLTGADSIPTLIEDCERTISRVLPEGDELPNERSQIHGGRTLGRFASPITLLQAASGSGSGVYLQQVVIVMPEHEQEGASGTLIVHLTSAP